MQLSTIKVKEHDLPLGNPEETFGDPCYLSVSSEVHWLLHGSSYVWSEKKPIEKGNEIGIS